MYETSSILLLDSKLDFKDVNFGFKNLIGNIFTSRIGYLTPYQHVSLALCKNMYGKNAIFTYA